MSKEKFGLTHLPFDKRDFNLGAFYFLPRLEELPESFELERKFPVKHQGGSDYCSAYASCVLSEFQEDAELYPPYSFALSKVISGDVDAWGQNLRDSLKAHQKYGAIETIELKHDAINSRNLSDYPQDFVKKALEHKKKSYFQTKGQYDAYDNIRASIFKFQSAVTIGVIFGWPLSQYKLDTVEIQGFGHAMAVVGYNTEGLIVVNSYGTSAGKEGLHIMTREVINANISRFGAFMLKDIEPSDVKEQMKVKEWTLSHWYGKMYILLRNWIKDIWE